MTTARLASIAIITALLSSNIAPSFAQKDAKEGKGEKADCSVVMQDGMNGGRQYGMMGGMRQGMMQGHMMKFMFAIADADNDNALSFEEVSAIHKRIFDKVDANKDGKVTPEEMKAFMRDQ
ncbi:EF-hand domain-containing protein [Ensifer sp. 2YAB10]|uniref:EF-hand domain-containing protein n=1 Tax=unclassified Ensifer TaxID=2633371 RepID=UPI000DE3317D